MRMLLLSSLLICLPVFGQTVQCVEVPNDQKIVLIPKFIPAEQLQWIWRFAVDPQERSADEWVYEDCVGEDLELSPSICVPGWQRRE